MNPTFHFSRIRLLFTRYFTEHWRRDLIAYATLFIIFAFVPRMGASSIPFFPFMIFCCILFIRGMHFSAHIFTEIHYPSSGMHYFHIPASRTEKFFVNGFITLILFPLLCFALYYGGVLFGNLLEPVMPSVLHYKVIDISTLIPSSHLSNMTIKSDPFSSSSSAVAEVLLAYFYLQALFMLGSLFFKKHPTTKTITSLIVFGIALGVIQMVISKVYWYNVDMESLSMLKEKLALLIESTFRSRVITVIDDLSAWITALFLWVVSYLKFIEKEI